MKTIIYFLITMYFYTSFSLYPFSYDSAIYAAQKGDIKAADEKLKKIVVDAPDSADVLYDAGVIAHSLNNFGQAAGYFNRAAECAQNHSHLRFQSHFNAGNAYVSDKNLQRALEHYEKALAVEPDNEYACHNRDRVKQMLQEQEQQKNEQKDDDQKDEKDEQKNDQQKNEQSGNDENDQKQDDGNDQQQNGNKQQGQKQNKNSSEKQSDEKSQSQQGDDSEQESKSAEGKEQRNTQKNQQQSSDNEERNGKQQFDEKLKRAQEERDKQQGKQHEKTPSEQQNTQNETTGMAADKQEQGAQEQQQGILDEQSIEQKINDPWLLRILNEQEKHDKAINKQLMEARVRQHGGKNGQNCW